MVYLHTNVTDTADRYDCTITNVDGTMAILPKMVLGAKNNHLGLIIIQLIKRIIQRIDIQMRISLMQAPNLLIASSLAPGTVGSYFT